MLENIVVKKFLSKKCWSKNLGSDTLQTPFKHFPDTLQTCSRHPPNMFQTPSRHLPDTLQTPFKHPPDTYQTPCRHFTDTLQTPYRHPTDTLQTLSTQDTLRIGQISWLEVISLLFRAAGSWIIKQGLRQDWEAATINELTLISLQRTSLSLSMPRWCFPCFYVVWSRASPPEAV